MTTGRQLRRGNRPFLYTFCYCAIHFTEVRPAHTFCMCNSNNVTKQGLPEKGDWSFLYGPIHFSLESYIFLLEWSSSLLALSTQQKRRKTDASRESATHTYGKHYPEAHNNPFYLTPFIWPLHRIQSSLRNVRLASFETQVRGFSRFVTIGENHTDFKPFQPTPPTTSSLSVGGCCRCSPSPYDFPQKTH